MCHKFFITKATFIQLNSKYIFYNIQDILRYFCKLHCFCNFIFIINLAFTKYNAILALFPAHHYIKSNLIFLQIEFLYFLSKIIHITYILLMPLNHKIQMICQRYINKVSELTFTFTFISGSFLLSFVKHEKKSYLLTKVLST